MFRGSEDRPQALTEFGDLFTPTEAAEPILARPVRNALTDWLTEIWAEDELRAVGLKPRKKAIFSGKPGVGKTTLAHHLSARLGLNMVAVRPERLIDKWVGSTGRNIGALFDTAMATEEPTVLFLDEFDAIGLKRRDATQGAEDERNAYINTLLQRIEQYQGYLIAATNFDDHIDPAIWRRFDMHITLQLPGQGERRRILARYLAPFGLPRDELDALATAFETASPALIRQFCESLKRQIVIGPKVDWDMRREAVIERVVTSIQPHPDVGKPRLWSHGASDKAVIAMTWPLPRADEIDQSRGADAASDAEPDPVVVKFQRGRP